MEWDRSLETGNRAIDDQHRAVVALLGELETAEAHDDPIRVRSALEQLTEHVAVHFTMEEDLMRDEGLPERDIDAHMAEHSDLNQRTREMVLKYRTGELSSVAAIISFLREWLAEHVCELDRVLADHIRRQRSGG